MLWEKSSFDRNRQEDSVYWNVPWMSFFYRGNTGCQISNLLKLKIKIFSLFLLLIIGLIFSFRNFKWWDFCTCYYSPYFFFFLRDRYFEIYFWKNILWKKLGNETICSFVDSKLFAKIIECNILVALLYYENRKNEV